LAFFAFFSSTYNLRDIYVFRKSPVRHEWMISAEGRQQSETMNKFFAPLEKLPSQGVLIAGGTAFGYDGMTIDLLGLSNTQMAHAAKLTNDKNLKNHASFNKGVFYKQKPDIFWLGGGFHQNGELKIRPDFKKLAQVAFQNIHLDKEFNEKYGYYLIKKVETDEVLEVFAARSFINNLPNEIFSVNETEYE
jgi:arabinofuranosyltransferase